MVRHVVHEVPRRLCGEIPVSDEVTDDVDGLQRGESLLARVVQCVTVIADPPRALPRGDLLEEVAGLGLSTASFWSPLVAK